MKRMHTKYYSLLLISILAAGTSMAQTEILIGGNMESDAAWTITYLNTPDGFGPIANYNYTTDAPAAGAGGCLYVSSAAEANQRQYCLYQEVTLSNGKKYNFNAAFKDISTALTDSWVEIFLGTEPVQGEDYGEGQRLLAKFSTWDACTHEGIDGTFLLDGCHNGEVIPDTSGTYYFVFKVGTLPNNAFDVLIDELSLTETASKPYPAFGANNLSGFAPLTVNFTDMSKMADSWAWDFGDGGSSVEQNPEHTYDAVGKYTVTLTATNAEGDSVVVKTDYITVNEDTELPEGEKLYGGNMESPDFWNITNLDAPTLPTATWNYTADAPTAGEGGNLHLTATVTNSTSHYCIWQPVELLADSAYTFDGAFKDVTGVVNFWCEVYIGTVPPADGSDYGADSIKIAQFQTWSDCTGSFVDGTFQNDGCAASGPVVAYQPEEDGTYYLAIKVGNTDWEGNTISYEIMLDEITLKESTPVIVPVADFFADIASGDAPLTVQFYNQSENAVDYLWNFGDGGTSTSEEPSHTYTEDGIYTVSLIAFGEGTSDTLTIENLITVGAVGLNSTNQPGLSVYPNPISEDLHIKHVNAGAMDISLFNTLGELVLRKTTADETLVIPMGNMEKGIYILKVNTETLIYTKTLILE